MKEKKKYKCCTNKHSIRLDVLEKYVLDSINELLKKCNNSLLKKELENKLEKDKLRDNTIINISKEKVALEKKINETKSYFKNLYQDKINGIISEEEFIMLRKEY